MKVRQLFLNIKQDNFLLKMSNPGSSLLSGLPTN